MTTMVDRIKVVGSMPKEFTEILTPQALQFLYELHTQFNGTRESLIEARTLRQESLNKGILPDFLNETVGIRNGVWQVASCPGDLQDRRVEITGPVDRKMIINALNCGANVFMADFEDATSPAWTNLIEGQLNLKEAVRKTLSLSTPEGKSYKLNEKVATLKVRPRGWHLPEKHVLIDGKPISGSLLDFGLYFFHNAEELIARGSGPYFYIPKLESHLEARLWNDVFNFAQDYLKIPKGTVRATVLIETITAAFEMDEILYELRDHASGLNAGRWDYLFSMIKKMCNTKDFMLPDRAQIPMSVPFMRAYCDLLVKTCHHRNAHAMGGMAAFIPTRKDAELNKVAMAKVTEDKKREAGQGFDGTWVAHPDLIAVAKEEFDKVLASQPNQKSKMREDVHVTRDELLNTKIEGSNVTEAGLVNNISVALLYIDSWLRGIGAAAIYNLMEDAATAEISRAQLWLWVHRGAQLSNGQTRVTADFYKQKKAEELARLTAIAPGRLQDAGDLLDQLVLPDEFVDFLTLPAYERLTAAE